MRFHHVGYLVKDICASIKSFEGLGFILETKTKLDEQREAFITFLKKDGITVELIQPQSENSPLYSLLRHYKNSPYHICFSSDNITEYVKKLTGMGGILFLETMKRLYV